VARDQEKVRNSRMAEITHIPIWHSIPGSS